MNRRFFITITILFCIAHCAMAQTTSSAQQVVTFSVRISHQPVIAASQQAAPQAANQNTNSNTVVTITSESSEGTATAIVSTPISSADQVAINITSSENYAFQQSGGTLTP